MTKKIPIARRNAIHAALHGQMEEIIQSLEQHDDLLSCLPAMDILRAVPKPANKQARALCERLLKVHQRRRPASRDVRRPLVALHGESGTGKTVLAKLMCAALYLHHPPALDGSHESLVEHLKARRRSGRGLQYKVVPIFIRAKDLALAGDLGSKSQDPWPTHPLLQVAREEYAKDAAQEPMEIALFVDALNENDVNDKELLSSLSRLADSPAAALIMVISRILPADIAGRFHESWDYTGVALGRVSPLFERRGRRDELKRYRELCERFPAFKGMTRTLTFFLEEDIAPERVIEDIFSRAMNLDEQTERDAQGIALSVVETIKPTERLDENPSFPRSVARWELEEKLLKQRVVVRDGGLLRFSHQEFLYYLAIGQRPDIKRLDELLQSSATIVNWLPALRLLALRLSESRVADLDRLLVTATRAYRCLVESHRTLLNIERLRDLAVALRTHDQRAHSTELSAALAELFRALFESLDHERSQTIAERISNEGKRDRASSEARLQLLSNIIRFLDEVASASDRALVALAKASLELERKKEVVPEAEALLRSQVPYFLQLRPSRDDRRPSVSAQTAADLLNVFEQYDETNNHVLFHYAQTVNLASPMGVENADMVRARTWLLDRRRRKAARPPLRMALDLMFPASDGPDGCELAPFLDRTFDASVRRFDAALTEPKASREPAQIFMSEDVEVGWWVATRLILVAALEHRPAAFEALRHLFERCTKSPHWIERWWAFNNFSWLWAELPIARPAIWDCIHRTAVVRAPGGSQALPELEVLRLRCFNGFLKAPPDLALDGPYGPAFSELTSPPRDSRTRVGRDADAFDPFATRPVELQNAQTTTRLRDLLVPSNLTVTHRRPLRVRPSAIVVETHPGTATRGRLTNNVLRVVHTIKKRGQPDRLMVPRREQLRRAHLRPVESHPQSLMFGVGIGTFDDCSPKLHDTSMLFGRAFVSPATRTAKLPAPRKRHAAGHFFGFGGSVYATVRIDTIARLDTILRSIAEQLGIPAVFGWFGYCECKIVDAIYNEYDLDTHILRDPQDGVFGDPADELRPRNRKQDAVGRPVAGIGVGLCAVGGPKYLEKLSSGFRLPDSIETATRGSATAKPPPRRKRPALVSHNHFLLLGDGKAPSIETDSPFVASKVLETRTPKDMFHLAGATVTRALLGIVRLDEIEETDAGRTRLMRMS